MLSGLRAKKALSRKGNAKAKRLNLGKERRRDDIPVTRAALSGSSLQEHQSSFKRDRKTVLFPTKTDKIANIIFLNIPFCCFGALSASQCQQGISDPSLLDRPLLPEGAGDHVLPESHERPVYRTQVVECIFTLSHFCRFPRNQPGSVFDKQTIKALVFGSSKNRQVAKTFDS